MLDSSISAIDRERAESLIRDAREARGGQCPDCDRVPCGHEYLVNVVMGTKNRPRCVHCLAKALERNPDDLLEQALAYVADRRCFVEAWSWAGREEGLGAIERPGCLWPDEVARLAERAAADERDSSARDDMEDSVECLPEPAAQVWDAGDMGCGDLLLELRVRMGKMVPGEVLDLTALDPGARADLPAWCRLTGETLVAARHPRYWIRREPKAT